MKIVLIGDSIRMGYQPLVASKCREVEVWGPDENCRHGVRVLDHFEEWVVDPKPDLVHVNFGLHDAAIQADGAHQIILAQYRLCLQRFIHRLRELGNTGMIWAATTPTYAPEQGVPVGLWGKREGERIDAYNAAASEIIQREGFPINDLHEVIIRNDFTKCLTEDGCHMTEYGNEVLADAVVESIRAFDP